MMSEGSKSDNVFRGDDLNTTKSGPSSAHQRFAGGPMVAQN